MLAEHIRQLPRMENHLIEPKSLRQQTKLLTMGETKLTI